MCTRDCSADTDCTLFNPASVCENGKCTDSNDPINTIPPFTTPALPTTCVTDLDCYGVSQCHVDSGQCICLHNLTWDGTQWVCNKSCVEDSECDSDTVCNAGSCVPQITSSGLCETDADCTSPLVCHTGSGLCECQTDVVWQARMSWSCPEVGATTVSPPVTTPINGPCTRDEHCPGVSTCDNNPGVCVCLHTPPSKSQLGSPLRNHSLSPSI